MQRRIAISVAFAAALIAITAPAWAAGSGVPTASTHAAAISTANINFPAPTPEMRTFSRICYVLDFLWPVWQLLLLWLILRSGLAATMRDKARSVSKNPIVAFVGFMALYTVVATLCNFPLSFYAGYWLDHQYGLSHEGFGEWLGDDVKSILVNFAIRAPVLGLVFWLMTRWPKNWELRFWLALIPLIAIGIFAQPLIVEPLFNKFTPMPPSPLRGQIHALAVKAGIPNAPILVSDMSRQTDETNAYVDGIGSSARIVIWDTTLKKMPEDQIVAVMGHEMGHYVLKHVYWGFLGAVIFLLIALPIFRRIYDAFVLRNRARWKIDGPADFAAIPALLFVFILLSFLSDPIVNAASREIEHQADAYGLKVTGNPVPMAQAFVALSKDNLSEPDPPAVIQFWFENHPSLKQRVDFVLGKSGTGIWRNAIAPSD